MTNLIKVNKSVGIEPTLMYFNYFFKLSTKKYFKFKRCDLLIFQKNLLNMGAQMVQQTNVQISLYYFGPGGQRFESQSQKQNKHNFLYLFQL